MTHEARKTAQLAMGRIFGMMLRQEQAGDVAEFIRCRNIIMGAVGDIFQSVDMSHDFGRDYKSILMSGQ